LECAITDCHPSRAKPSRAEDVLIQIELQQSRSQLSTLYCHLVIDVLVAFITSIVINA